MISLFIGLTLVNLVCLGTAAGLGYATTGGMKVGQWHLLAGALATIACCGVHCIVFTYFIATGKWIQHAIEVKRLDPAIGNPTRSFKAQAFPAAIAAMGIVFLTAIFGAAADNDYAGTSLWHHLLALSAIAVNLAVAAIEYRAILRNGELIDEILAMIARQPKPIAAPTLDRSS